MMQETYKLEYMTCCVNGSDLRIPFPDFVHDIATLGHSSDISFILAEFPYTHGDSM